MYPSNHVGIALLDANRGIGQASLTRRNGRSPCVASRRIPRSGTRRVKDQPARISRAWQHLTHHWGVGGVWRAHGRLICAVCILSWASGAVSTAIPHPLPAVGQATEDAAWETSKRQEIEASKQGHVDSSTFRGFDVSAPLPPTVRVQRHFASGTASDATRAPNDADDVLIYSNTYGQWYFAPRTHIRIADDLVTTAIGTCELSKFLIGVTGGVEDGNGTFDVTVALFDVCPGDLPYNAPAIPGTEFTFRRISDNYEIVHELVVDYTSGSIGICDDLRACRIDAQDCLDGSECVAGPPIELPQRPWLRVEFSTDDAGWLVGARPERGYSDDDVMSHLFTGCRSWFGGYPFFPPQNFYTQIYAQPECATQWLTYQAADSYTDAFDPPGGTDRLRLADDIELVVDTCDLSTLEIGTRGEEGPFEIEFDLRDYPTYEPIPGTQRTFTGIGDGSLEIARLVYDGGIDLPKSFWITWQANKPHTGVPNVGRTQVGYSRDVYGAFDHPSNPDEWEEYVTPHYRYAAFHVSVFCRGDAPTGACCFTTRSEAEAPNCFDDVGVVWCHGGRWLEGATCDDNEFDPPCGAHACCLPDSTCANLHETDCTALGGIWESGEFCDEQEQYCGWFLCRSAGDNCYIPHNSRGCDNQTCCNRVCDFDPWCCTVGWDETCVRWSRFCWHDPANDECWNPYAGREAMLVAANSTTIISNTAATFEPYDPPFCCGKVHNGARGYGTLWFQFVATDTSARISTCNTNPDWAGDSALQAFSVGNTRDPDLGVCENANHLNPCSIEAQNCSYNRTCVHDEGFSRCNSLDVIACSDNASACGAGLQSEICASSLVPGETYYIELASVKEDDRGVYQLDIESPCGNEATLACPDGEITWVDPPPDTIDARQPHDILDPSLRHGIDTITVGAPRGADLAGGACWSLCETTVDGWGNSIETITDNEDGTYTIRLDEPITPTASVTISYGSGSSCTSAAAQFTSLPGDVDGNGISEAEDVYPLINCCLDRSCEPAHAAYSCDIDHSQTTDAADVLRIIDLLNGAGSYREWLFATPDNEGECP